MRHLAAAALMLTTLAPGAAQTSSDTAATTLLARLTGAWTGTGTILGQAATVEMEWTPVLDDRFMRLTFTSHIGPAPATRHFEGHAYYEVRPEGRLRATWFDSSGLTRPIEGVADATTLVSAWGSPETELGETTYRLVSDRQMEVVDRVQRQDGTWREFGRSTLSRTLPPR